MEAKRKQTKMIQKAENAKLEDDGTAKRELDFKRIKIYYAYNGEKEERGES